MDRVCNVVFSSLDKSVGLVGLNDDGLIVSHHYRFCGDDIFTKIPFQNPSH